jgi:hypothetical protein
VSFDRGRLWLNRAVTAIKPALRTTSSSVKAFAITVEPTTIGPDTDPVTIEADTTDVPCGLYEGSLLLGPSERQPRVPALFYVNNARPGAYPAVCRCPCDR